MIYLIKRWFLSFASAATDRAFFEPARVVDAGRRIGNRTGALTATTEFLLLRTRRHAKHDDTK